jgi:hypothetical protein
MALTHQANLIIIMYDEISTLEKKNKPIIIYNMSCIKIKQLYKDMLINLAIPCTIIIETNDFFIILYIYIYICCSKVVVKHL